MGDGKRILIVDDDHRNIFALSATLRARKYQCVTAADAQTALDMLASGEKVDAVLMDMMMPEMDGYEAVRRMRRDDRTRQLPVIAVTAQAMPGDREKCLEAGADHYLVKPVDVDKLLSLLTKICDDSRK
jgi:two-component system, cell cycle response regulator DivK